MMVETTETFETLAARQAHDLLTQAADRCLPLLLQADDRHGRCRFLSGGRDGLWTDKPVSQDKHVPIELSAGERLSVELSVKLERYLFRSRVLHVGRVRLAGGQSAEGLLIARPAQVQRIQRRSNFRVEIPMSESVSLRLWRGAWTQPDQPALCAAKLVNLSLSGAMIRLPAKGPQLEPGERLVVEMRINQAEHHLAAEVVRCRVETTGRFIGMRFLDLEVTEAGRSALKTITTFAMGMERRMLRLRR